MYMEKLAQQLAPREVRDSMNLRQVCGLSARRYIRNGKECERAPGITAQQLFITINKINKEEN